MTWKQMLPIVIVVLGVIGYFGFKQVQPQSPCTLMAAAADPKDFTLKMDLEPLGNTEAWADETSSLVRAQLLSAATRDPTTPFSPFVANIDLFANGEPVNVTQGCGQTRYTLRPAAELVARWNSATSPDAKSEPTRELEDARNRRIDEIVDTVKNQVLMLDFHGTDPHRAKMSPVPLVQKVASTEPRPDVAVLLSPLASTVEDCLHFDDPTFDFVVASAANEAVENCVKRDQLGIMSAHHIEIWPSRLANPEQIQQKRSRNLAIALCEHATADPSSCKVPE